MFAGCGFPATQREEPRMEALREIARYEASVRPTLITWLLRWLGRTKAFAFFYRQFGPRLDKYLMRRTGLVGKLYGLPALLITTTGAKSGQARTQPLLYIRDGDDFLVLGTNFGQLHHPAWTANLLAHPAATIEVGGVPLTVRGELVEGDDWRRHFECFAAVYPGYRDYLTRCGDRTPRMFRLRATE